METMSLAGLVALVTGAGGGAEGGMGAGIARCLGQQGATVVVNDLDGEYAARTVAQLEGMGVQAMAVVGDVSSTEAVAAMVDQILARWGHLDILVNNAGIGGRVPAVERMPDEIWFRTIAVDLTGPFKLARAVIPHMQRRRWGRIINIASVAGHRTGYMSGAAYTAAKSGLLGFTRHLALEVGEWGITVNALLPGGTRTPPLLRNTPKEVQEALAESVILRRLADPEDIGAAAAFLASPAAGYITGVALPVDGGTSVPAGDFTAYRANSRKDAG
ncbi:MAG: 3-oxoacyl-ACP reductase FabG [Firmicutes bacterium]|nr:3-oxoacyl-ACP reductase FabG [Alicyclobacillaceae bacterium]MCL6497541.1 3-oxoacyl-ACP reductase FabG [Bacillota bacterium]